MGIIQVKKSKNIDFVINSIFFLRIKYSSFFSLEINIKYDFRIHKWKNLKDIPLFALFSIFLSFNSNLFRKESIFLGNIS